MNAETRSRFGEKPYKGTVIIEKTFDKEVDGEWCHFIKDEFLGQDFLLTMDAEAKKALKSWLRDRGITSMDFNDVYEDAGNQYKVYIRIMPGRKLGNALLEYGFKEVRA